MNNLKLAFKFALQSFISNKEKSYLAMLGIFIGILSVVLVNAVGGGAQSLIVQQLQTMGTNLVGVLPGNTGDSGPPAAVYGIIITTLNNDDLKDIRKVPHVLEAEGITRGMGAISYRNKVLDSSFNGISYTMPYVENITLKYGRFYTKQEEDAMTRVVVLGSEINDELFEGMNPIGQKIKIKNHYFTIIGVLESRGSTGFSNKDNVAIIPLSVSQKLLLGINHLSIIRAKVDYTENIPFTLEEIRKVLRINHKLKSSVDDDFSVRSLSQAIDILSGITGFLRTFLSAIAAISLLVGGVGIMNIMYVSITERTKEIGIRKALGAQYNTILLQFLLEACMITIIGGLLGMIVGFGLAYLIYILAINFGLENWEFVISWSGLIVASIITVAIGVVFGYYPAQKAAKLNPIEALRYE
jgi:putative ABC transport system permease protein